MDDGGLFFTFILLPILIIAVPATAVLIGVTLLVTVGAAQHALSNKIAARIREKRELQNEASGKPRSTPRGR